MILDATWQLEGWSLNNPQMLFEEMSVRSAPQASGNQIRHRQIDDREAKLCWHASSST